jgi:hypothetical protein
MVCQKCGFVTVILEPPKTQESRRVMPQSLRSVCFSTELRNKTT